MEEIENITHEEVVEKWYIPLIQVTTLSKYVALLLFIVLPFIGGWIGYTYAPEKVVEVEKIIEIEVQSERGEVDFETEDLVLDVDPVNMWRYLNERYGFSILMPDFIEKDDFEEEVTDFATHITVLVDYQKEQGKGHGLTITVIEQEKFNKTFYLEDRSGRGSAHAWSIEYPEDPSPGTYLGENYEYVFLYHPGHDSPLGEGMELRQMVVETDFSETFEVVPISQN